MTKHDYDRLKTVALFLMHTNDGNDYDDEFNNGAAWAGHVLMDALQGLYKEPQTPVLLKAPINDLCP